MLVRDEELDSRPDVTRQLMYDLKLAQEIEKGRVKVLWVLL